MAQPLAERLRPTSFDNYVGQQHLVGEGAVLRRMIDSGRILSFILPPCTCFGRKVPLFPPYQPLPDLWQRSPPRSFRFAFS